MHEVKLFKIKNQGVILKKQGTKFQIIIENFEEGKNRIHFSR
jgi:hypothetical protein